MRGPQVRFCERPGGAIPRAYSTAVNGSRAGVEGRGYAKGVSPHCSRLESKMSLFAVFAIQ